MARKVSEANGVFANAPFVIIVTFDGIVKEVIWLYPNVLFKFPLMICILAGRLMVVKFAQLLNVLFPPNHCTVDGMVIVVKVVTF